MNSFNDFPYAEDLAIRNIASKLSYEDFISQLNEDIDLIVADMMDGVENFIDRNEKNISYHIYTNLKSKNYSAEYDSDKNGNADISVSAGSYEWLAEAKIFGGKNNYNTDYLYGGFKQLTTRYSKCQGNADCGAMFIYIHPRSADDSEKNVMDAWNSFLEGKKLELNQLCIIPHSGKDRSLYTQHIHGTSGYPYKVRHIPLCFFHLPEDKSGVNAKKYNETREKFLNFDSKEEHF